jgi:hypothetical protein
LAGGSGRPLDVEFSDANVEVGLSNIIGESTSRSDARGQFVLDLRRGAISEQLIGKRIILSERDHHFVGRESRRVQ